MIAVTLRFNYPVDNNCLNKEELDEEELMYSLYELTPEELLMAAKNMGEPINMDIEVY